MSHRKGVHAFMMGLVWAGMAISAHGCKESPDTSAQSAPTSERKYSLDTETMGLVRGVAKWF